MSIIKSSLNKLIIKMVTRERVLKVSGLKVEDFNKWVNDIIAGQYSSAHEYSKWLAHGYDGVDCFIKDFCKEGWCKRELRDILDTLFHLNREIDDYAGYWF